jgi:hypothetical protein
VNDVNERGGVTKGNIPRGEEGQTMIEFAMSLALFLLVAIVFGLMAWWWWSQTVAATAIHDGTRHAAMLGGDTGAGQAEVQHLLQIGLGGFASDYSGSYSIQEQPGQRAVFGSLYHELQTGIPGFPALVVRSTSFQRKERFYGGPPDPWE